MTQPPLPGRKGAWPGWWGRLDSVRPRRGGCAVSAPSDHGHLRSDQVHRSSAASLASILRFSAKLKCLFALTVASSGLQLEVVLRKGQRLLDRGPYTGAWTEAALAPRAAAHRTSPPSPAVTGRRGRGAYDAPSRRAASRNAARVECARKAAAPAAPATTASALLSCACCCTARLSEPAARFAWSSAESPAAAAPRSNSSCSGR